MLVLAKNILLHPDDCKKALKQTKIEDYFKSNLNKFK